MNPVISICASANRVQFWPDFLDSLRGNRVPYEVIFVGDVKPPQELLDKYPELTYIYATCKPCQCYQIAFWHARGILGHWTADDATYSMIGLPKHLQSRLPQDVTMGNDTLDRAYAEWLKMEDKHNHDGKSVVAFRPIEDGGDVQLRQHYFFGQCTWTPRMAPFALVPMKYLAEGSGYDNRFVSGQAENDIIMNVFADGGRVDVAMDALIYVHHHKCHKRDPNSGRELNDFRAWYPKDREALENAWVVEGYGFTQKYPDNDQLRKHVTVSNRRLSPTRPYLKTPDVCTVSQGEKGKWA